MWLRWFPWRWLISRIARARGLLDPVKLLSRLEGFAQPLEVKEPLELLRAGMVFHARGLLNAGAIQHNLDWVWPCWIERQYDPEDDAFLPRAFSLTHINLTLRNWTAIGVPDEEELPLVDPRGLVTPFWDGWSLDTWVLAEDGRCLFPSRLPEGVQGMEFRGGPVVVTGAVQDGLELVGRATVERPAGETAHLVLEITATADGPAWLAVALRPYNPEGVSFLHGIRRLPGGEGWEVDPGVKRGEATVLFSEAPERHRFSHYRLGDVAAGLLEPAGDPVAEAAEVCCDVGMATAAALYAVPEAGSRSVTVRVPLSAAETGMRRLLGPVAKLVRPRPKATLPPTWQEALAGSARLEVPDSRERFLYQAALTSLVLHSPDEVYPGPYTYKRFWFRDSAFILHALLIAGFPDRVERCLEHFPRRQTAAGFFLSQEGEWDSNGEALWILDRFCLLTGQPLRREWIEPVVRGLRWIARKRLPSHPSSPHAGLLPPGFSAEHLGPNNYYYWDDFWGIAGLCRGAALLDGVGLTRVAREARAEAQAFLADLEASLAGVEQRLGRPGMPASPYRRLDSGAIGSLAAGYPLQLFAPDDRRLLDTAEFLLAECRVGGGFFLDMIHSGINPYLTLHLAQVLLRAGDPRSLTLARELLTAVADLASPTGQWPEAVHPRTRGGCMGDGHHAWASAEWVLALRNRFVREEGGGLILAAGLDPAWLAAGEPCSFGPTPTPHGPVTVQVNPGGNGVDVIWEGRWRGKPPSIEVRLPGFAPRLAPPGVDRLLFACPVAEASNPWPAVRERIAV